MALYCGIDLHSSNCWISIIDEERKVVREKKMGNDLAAILEFLEPNRAELVGIAVESTFNWYWLVDGLAEAGYQMHLTNTWAIKQYEGLKYTDDRHDARWLGHLLSLGILPEGYIYPKEDRVLRDLLLRRSFLVHKRTSFLLSMRGAFECRTGMRTTSADVKKWTPADVEQHIDDPLAALGITCLLEPMTALNDQIKILEKEALKRAKLRDEFKRLQTVWGIGQFQEWQPLSLLGELGGCPFFGAPPRGSKEVRRTETSQNERHRGDQSVGSQAGKSVVLHHEGSSGLRSRQSIWMILRTGAEARIGAWNNHRT